MTVVIEFQYFYVRIKHSDNLNMITPNALKFFRRHTNANMPSTKFYRVHRMFDS
jgi:hypothetical protein